MLEKDGHDEDSCCHNSPCIICYLAIPDGKSFDAPSQCLPSIQEAEIGTFADVYEKISRSLPKKAKTFLDLAREVLCLVE